MNVEIVGLWPRKIPFFWEHLIRIFVLGSLQCSERLGGVYK
jgi:hypothetical protein